MWCGPASVTVLDGSGGTRRGCLGRSDSSRSTALPADLAGPPFNSNRPITLAAKGCRSASCGKSACCVRCGGNWRRDYGGPYTGTQGETPDTAKELPTNYRASSRPSQAAGTTWFLAQSWFSGLPLLVRLFCSAALINVISSTLKCSV